MKEKLERNPRAGGHFLESFKALATNIQFSGIDKPIKSILVTSTLPSEGKSTIALYLAQTFAEAGKRTLLLETDMRRPVLRRRLTEKKKAGFINYITGQVEYDEIVSQISENLCFINCGAIPPDAVEVLTSERFANFVKEMHDKFEMIIFDAPPLAVFIDAAIISARVDGTVLVVDSGSIDYKKAQDSVEQLKKANARILGVILNNVNVSDSNYYYYNNYNNTPGNGRHSERKRKKNALAKSFYDRLTLK